MNNVCVYECVKYNEQFLWKWSFDFCSVKVYFWINYTETNAWVRKAGNGNTRNSLTVTD